MTMAGSATAATTISGRGGRPGWRRRTRVIVFATLFTSQLGVLLGTERAIGFTRDEATYFSAGRDYWPFWSDLATALVPGSRVRLRDVLTDRRIDATFAENSEHPALMKSLFGASRALFATGRHPLLHESTALRLPGMAMGALATALAYALGAELFSDLAGLAAALLFATLPRAFFHAHLACFDIPITAMTLLVVYCYLRALAGPIGWSLATGAAFGLALATKMNAFFVPLFLAPHAAFLLARRRARPRAVAAPFVAMAVLGPAIFLAHWPWLWHDTVTRFQGYLAFFAHHSYYNIEYLGRNYNHPPFPWHDPLVWTALVTPTVTLALACGGFALFGRHACRTYRTHGGEAAASEDPRAPGLLVAVTSLPWLALFMTRTTPIFGAAKHWLPAMPVLCVAAGFALDRLARGLAAELRLDARRAALASGALLAVVLLPCAVETARAHPDGLSYYTELAGGFAGGADLGMDRQFWGYALKQALPWLDRNASPGALVYLHDGSPAYDQYLREGMLRRDLGNAGQEEPAIRASRYAALLYEKHMSKYEYMIWSAYGTTRPSWVLTRDDVPLVALYARPAAGRWPGR